MRGRRSASASAAVQQAEDPGVELDAAAAGIDRLVDDEGAEDGRRDEADDERRAPREAAPAERHRTGGAHARGADGEDGDDDPRARHARRSPTSAASDAAMIGTPGGVNGIRAKAIAAPASPAISGRRLRASSKSRAR